MDPATTVVNHQTGKSMNAQMSQKPLVKDPSHGVECPAMSFHERELFQATHLLLAAASSSSLQKFHIWPSFYILSTSFRESIS